ncbi:hypothetical protein [Synechocystis sp. LKSZ1]|uniref:hypothetical protein n=1 Tax=Synechocystis sp. LKSZ1 TaxID=3144951 RepID=UPI00336BDD05
MLDADHSSFLTPAESALVEQAQLDQSEKFLTRLTISSLRLLMLISAKTEVSLTDLTPEQIITWFEQEAKAKQTHGESVLKW